MTPKRVMIIAGEASGDILAAELVKELRAGFQARSTYRTDVQPIEADLAPRFFGAGGPRMADAGVEVEIDMMANSVVGLTDVLGKLAKIKRTFDQLFALAVARQPDLIIGVDFSVFNCRFAAAIRRYTRSRRGPFNNWNPKLIKYVSPQVWASRESRARQLARDFDLLLSIFPFEKDWYAARVPQLRVEFVGHPMIERYGDLRDQPRDENLSSPPVLLLLPGSRPAELKRHLPVMLPALKLIQAALPNLRARMVLPSETILKLARDFPLPSGLEAVCGGLADALAAADVAIASTGTVTMECAFFGVPAVTIYKTSWSTYQIGKRLVRVKSLTMPNLMANAEVYPEFIQEAATPENISGAALELLRDPTRRAKIKAQLAEIIASLGGPGAGQRAARAITDLLEKR